MKRKVKKFWTLFPWKDKKTLSLILRIVHLSAGWGESRQDDKLCVCVYVQWMCSLCVLFSMTIQTDGVWPLVWSVEEPAMTWSCADAAGRRRHSVRIVQTLRIEKEIGRGADRRMDGWMDTQWLCAFSLNVWTLSFLFMLQWPKASESSWEQELLSNSLTVRKKPARLWLSNQLIR